MKHLHLAVVIVLCATRTFSSRTQDDPATLQITKETPDFTLECSKSEEAENAEDLTTMKTKEDQMKLKTDLSDTLSQEGHGKTLPKDPFTKFKKEKIQEKEFNAKTTEISEDSKTLEISGDSTDIPSKSGGLKEALQKEEKAEEGKEKGRVLVKRDTWAVGGALSWARSSLISSIG
ncbi:hypothetical protein E2C01_044380 [Portunus trituberculatus]|uniref:Uncharacterized protein n=1 Tax=Portunus trituberculatus TaxID=210409 RepID=A0A5B7FSZ2_PORTR|nr:hypothetical protein [Portunus trituberculatus]